MSRRPYPQPDDQSPSWTEDDLGRPVRYVFAPTAGPGERWKTEDAARVEVHYWPGPPWRRRWSFAIYLPAWWRPRAAVLHSLPQWWTATGAEAAGVAVAIREFRR